MHHIHAGWAPQYLSDCVSTVSALGGRYRLRSTGSADCVLPRTRTKFGEQGFSYCGPAAWKTLPSDLHDIRDTDTFRKLLKSVLFDRTYHWLLLALLDVSYSGALQILRWLIDWFPQWSTSSHDAHSTCGSGIICILMVCWYVEFAVKSQWPRGNVTKWITGQHFWVAAVKPRCRWSREICLLPDLISVLMIWHYLALCLGIGISFDGLILLIVTSRMLSDSYSIAKLHEALGKIN